MIQLSYISSATHPVSTEDLLLLLQTCLENNQRNGLTGMLLYGNDTFLQTLEGDEETVDRLYEKILKDPRHKDIKSLWRKTIEKRQYAEWNMGFKRVSDEELTQVGGLIDFSERKFNVDYLGDHRDEASRLMDHFSSWDPLVRKVEEHERSVKDMKAMLAHARGCVEIAVLVLESIATTGKAGRIDDEHIRLCDLALNALRQVPQMASQAGGNARG